MSDEKNKHKPKSVEEDLQGIYEHDLLDENKKRMHPKLRKTFIIIIGIFSILLILSFLYLEFPLFGIIWGQMESKPLQQNAIFVGNITVFFDAAALNTIQTEYANNQKAETSLCLLGSIQDNYYHITSAYKPVIITQSFSQVTFVPCSNDTIIMFHTHPYKSCIASDVDLNTLKENKLNNPYLLMIIMCEPSRFSIY